MSIYQSRTTQDIDIIDLIHSYKQYECLWNVFNPDYKNKSVKQDAWDEMSSYFQRDVMELKRKIKNLRSAYVHEKKKVAAANKLGRNYKPSLFYFKYLDFLENVVIWRKFEGDKTSNSWDLDGSQDGQVEEENSFANRGEEEDVDIKQDIKCKTELIGESDTEHETQISVRNVLKPSLPSRTSASRPLKRDSSGEIKFNKSITTNTPIVPSSYTDQCKNLYQSFGNTIALQLHQLPKEMAVLAMSEIHTILTKKTLEHIRSLDHDRESGLHSADEAGYGEMVDEASNDSS